MTMTNGPEKWTNDCIYQPLEINPMHLAFSCTLTPPPLSVCLHHLTSHQFISHQFIFWSADLYTRISSHIRLDRFVPIVLILSSLLTDPIPVDLFLNLLSFHSSYRFLSSSSKQNNIQPTHHHSTNHHSTNTPTFNQPPPSTNQLTNQHSFNQPTNQPTNQLTTTINQPTN